MTGLSPERADDWWEVGALYDLCFAPGREALSSYRLREGVDPAPGLNWVWRDEDRVLGAAVRVWPVEVGRAEALLLGPIAVHPTRQGEGLGGILMRLVIAEARRHGWDRLMLVGDAPYYGRFGFARLEGVLMPPPTNPDRVLGLDLTPGAWRGVAGEVRRAR